MAYSKAGENKVGLLISVKGVLGKAKEEGFIARHVDCKLSFSRPIRGKLGQRRKSREKATYWYKETAQFLTLADNF